MGKVPFGFLKKFPYLAPMKTEIKVSSYGREMTLVISGDSTLEEMELVFKTILFFLEYPLQED